MVGKAGLILVVGFAVILGFISMNITRLSKSSTATMSSYADATLSHNLAETGANIGLARFYSDTTWYGDTTQTLNGPHFYGSVRYATTSLGPGLVKLRSISTYKSPSLPIAETLHDTVDVYFANNKAQTFSIFAWMTNSEGTVNWTGTDTVWGKVHSNSTINVNGPVVFYDKVTTTKNFNPTIKNGCKAIFKKTPETGVQSVDFPKDLSMLDTAAANHGRKYADSIWVKLYPGTSAEGDGKVVVRKGSKTGPVLDSIQLIPNNPTFNGVIASTRAIHMVKDTLDGALTVAALGSTSDIIIEDDITYEKNPQTTTSTDLLGLVANRNILVQDNPQNNVDCTIQACIFTYNGSFSAQDYDNHDHKHDLNPLFGKLNILGSIVQNTRGAVGTGSPSPVTGYSKRYRYDDRLSNDEFRPPYYPGFFKKTYAITNWWESFRVPNISQ